MHLALSNLCFKLVCANTNQASQTIFQSIVTTKYANNNHVVKNKNRTKERWKRNILNNRNHKELICITSNPHELGN